MCSEENVFKLVFSTDGTFLRAEAPEGAKVQKLDFNQMDELKLYDKKGEEVPLKELLLTGKAKVITFDEMAKLKLQENMRAEVSSRDLLLTGSRESIKFIDIPGNSICGVLSAAIGYSWCR